MNEKEIKEWKARVGEAEPAPAIDIGGSLVQASLGSLLRHLGTLLAGVLISHGLANETHTNEIVGLVIALGTFAWSQWQKRNQAAAVTKALYTQPPSGTPQ
jgi:hypothetical protein